MLTPQSASAVSAASAASRLGGDQALAAAGSNSAGDAAAAGAGTNVDCDAQQIIVLGVTLNTAFCR